MRFEPVKNLLRFTISVLLAVGAFLGRFALVVLAIAPTHISRAIDRVRVGPPGPPPRAGRRRRVLFVPGTLNHANQALQIAAELPECDVAFSWYYADGVLDLVRRIGWLESTALGKKLRARCLAFLQQHGLPLDLGGERGVYDLIVTCCDLTIPRNMRGGKVLLVQEGMTDPEDIIFRMIKALRLPPWLAVTSSTTGLGHRDYQRFCVSSEGYRDLFVRKGVPPEKIVVTGIPNFDNCKRFLNNDFPHRGYVLVCSSDIRETARWENRPKFIRKVLEIAAGRMVIWKLHPNENVPRARAELGRLAPDVKVYESGSAEEMIANCDVLVTQFSSTAYVGLALGKEVHSYFDVEELARLCPIQNGSASARRIADVCRELIDLPVPDAANNASVLETSAATTPEPSVAPNPPKFHTGA
jgi:hypothetical protein